MYRIEDLVGKKYNKLTIQGDSTEESTYRKVNCICECGNSKNIGLSYLMKEKITNCGCQPRPNKKNRIGEKHNLLTVVEEVNPHITKSGKKQTKVKCLCECGNFHEVVYRDLKRGEIKSCGCLTKACRLDISVHNNYGKLTIVGDAEDYISPQGEKQRRVKVRCECGGEKEINLQTLRRGTVTDCGCENKKRLEELKNSKPKKEVTRQPIPIDSEEEKWKPLLDVDGYLISDLGRVFSIAKGEYMSTEGKCSIRVKNNKSISLTKKVWVSFNGIFDETTYTVIHRDADMKNSSLSNLFLAHITYNKSNWVSKLLSNINAAARQQQGKQRGKEVHIKRHHLIDLYEKQKGMSYFLGLPMDMTCSHNLLSVSVDRIDNDRDYTPCNIRLVTRFENMGRRAATSEEFQVFTDYVKYYLHGNTDNVFN